MEELLITGSNGFLGGHLVKDLQSKFKIVTLSRKNADFCIDLAKNIPTNIPNTIKYVIHAAGKAHIIPKTKEEEQAFFDVNVMGTENLIKGLRNIKIENFIFISSVSVYGKDTGIQIDEKTELLGKTPYALSKIQAEKLVTKWCEKQNIKLLILRLPLLAASNPPGNLGDMISAIQKNRYLSINAGKAKRSVLLIKDLSDWLLTQNAMKYEGTYNLTDNYDPTFRELEVIISKQLNKKPPLSIPLFLAKMIGIIGDLLKLDFINSLKIKKITKDLTFSSKKAIQNVNWQPKKVTKHFNIFSK